LASKDQAIGALIFLVCVLLAIGYIIVLFFPQTVISFLQTYLSWISWTELGIRLWAVTIIVLIAFLAIMFIGAWIGWTMATTPPPKPIEEIETEEEKVEEEKPGEEKPVEEQPKEKPTEERKNEPKARKRRRKE